MTGSEKILSLIIDDAQRESDEIIDKANKKAEEIISVAKANAEVELKASEEKAHRAADVVENNSKSASELVLRNALLKCRRKAIDSLLDDVLTRLCKLSDADYFSMLLKMVSRMQTGAEGTLMLCSRDLSRAGEDFFASLNKISNGKLKPDTQTANITGGFILKYEDIEINASFEALRREKYGLLEDAVNKVLFSN